jgi:hypothetical protein
MFTPISFLIAAATVVVLMFLHEMAHYVSARAMQLRVIAFGIKTDTRVPHPFVEIGWTPDRRKRIIYLMAGVATTATLFTLMCLTTSFWLVPGIYLGFAVQLILETNPMFSDFIILRKMSKGSGPGRSNDEVFTAPWYLHFLLWGSIVILLLSPRFLPSLLFAV